MRVLFCGGSWKANSWHIRAVQIAAQRDEWLAIHSPTLEQAQGADIIVALKRVPDDITNVILSAKKPIIWDALDFWKQPEDDARVTTVAQAQKLAARWVERLKPRAIIAANQAMEADLQGMAEEVRCIYHHFRLNIDQSVAGRTLVYEGDRRFIGGWAEKARIYLRPLAWYFSRAEAGPGAGALLAVRDGEHGSFLSRRWKSNIKAANAVGLGIPFLAWPEEGYLETVPDGLGLWFESEGQFAEHVASFGNPETFLRASTAAAQVRDQYRIQNIAAQYEQLFESVLAA